METEKFALQKGTYAAPQETGYYSARTSQPVFSDITIQKGRKNRQKTIVIYFINVQKITLKTSPRKSPKNSDSVQHKT